MRVFRFLPIVIVVGLIILFAFALMRPRDPNVRGFPLQGQPAPAFTLSTLEGGRISLADLRGKPVVLNFWASWCVPCRDEAPILRAAQARHAARELIVLGVTVNDKPEDSQRFAQQFNLNFPSVIDKDGRVGVAYGVTGVPETYFVSRNGIIQSKHFGPINTEQLGRGIAALLK